MLQKTLKNINPAVSWNFMWHEIFFSLVTPFGVLIGLIVTAKISEVTPACLGEDSFAPSEIFFDAFNSTFLQAGGYHMLTVAVLQGIAAGSLLHVTFYEVIFTLQTIIIISILLLSCYAYQCLWGDIYLKMAKWLCADAYAYAYAYALAITVTWMKADMEGGGDNV